MVGARMDFMSFEGLWRIYNINRKQTSKKLKLD